MYQPLHRARIRKRKGDRDVRIQMAREFELVAIDDGEVGVAAAQPVERIGLVPRQLGPGEVGRAAGTQVPQQLQLRAVGPHDDPRAVQRGNVVRRWPAAPLHHQLLDLLIGRRRQPDSLPVIVRRELRRRDVGAAFCEQLAQADAIPGRLDDELNAKTVGEGPRQAVLEALRAMGAEIIGGGLVERGHSQLAAGAQLRQPR
jgi:hypothetical protein